MGTLEYEAARVRMTTTSGGLRRYARRDIERVRS